MRSRRAREVADGEGEETTADGRKRKEGARLREGSRGARGTDLARACIPRGERGAGGGEVGERSGRVREGGGATRREGGKTRRRRAQAGEKGEGGAK